MLVQHHLRIQEKRNVILHIHIDGVLQGGDLTQLRILVIRSVQRIVQLKQLLLSAVQHPENGILIRSFCLQRFIHDKLLSRTNGNTGRRAAQSLRIGGRSGILFLHSCRLSMGYIIGN